MPAIPPALGRLRRGSEFLGSGFIIGDGTLIATCAHVVGDPTTGAVSVGQELLFESLASIQTASEMGSAAPEGRVVKTTELFDEQHDIAILKLQDEEAHSEAMPEVALLAASRALRFTEPGGYSWRTAGYSLLADISATYDFTSTDGLLIGAAVRKGVDVLQLRGNDVQRGMSGAPVILDSYGVVIGMISERYHSPDDYNSNTVWAVRSEHILQVAQGLVTAVPIDESLLSTLTAFERLQHIAKRMSPEARRSIEVEIAKGYVFDR
jgi:S1-C subfamily serine protease